MNEKRIQSELIVNHKTGETKSQLLAKLPVPGPGSKKQTEEEKALNKSRRQLIEEYKDALAEALPMISPVLIKKAFSGQGDIQAIKEINDILVDKASGKAKPEIEVTLKTIIINKSNGNSDNKPSSETK